MGKLNFVWKKRRAAAIISGSVILVKSFSIEEKCFGNGKNLVEY